MVRRRHLRDRRRRLARRRGAQLLQPPAVRGASGVSVFGLEDEGRERGRRAGRRSLDHLAARDARRRRPLRALRLSARSRPLSPAITASLSPAARTWVRVTAAREMSAPGAEEFVPQAYGSLTLPPQRTFSAMVARRPLVGQETRHVGVALEQDIATFRVAVYALPPERRRPARDGVRPEPGQGPAPRRSEPLRRRQRRRFRRQRLGRRRQPPGGDAPARRGRVPRLGRRLAGRGRHGGGRPRRAFGGACRQGADARPDDARGRRRAADRHPPVGRLPLQLAVHARRPSTRTRRSARCATTSRSIRASRT